MSKAAPRSEASLQRMIQVRASQLGARLFRNHVGRYRVEEGYWLTCGLCKGSSDLIGWTPVTIGPDHVGRVLAVFTAVEVKISGGRVTAEQRRFLEVVRESGGISSVVRDPAYLESELHA